MDFMSKTPRLKDITYSHSPRSEAQSQSVKDGLVWIEGEQEISQCNGVLWISTVHPGNDPCSIKGSLILTNFRLRFVPDSLEVRDLSSKNKLLSKFDVVLYNIETIYKIKKNKKKRLLPGCLLKERVEKMEIVCKSFETVIMDLHMTNGDENNCIIYLLIEAVVTSQTDSLMIYAKHLDDNYIDECNLESYWSNLLERYDETSYKVVTCNESFHVTDSLPKCFVVSSSLSPKDVVAMATKFVNNRCPCWTYTYKPTRAALVRMAYKAPGVNGNVEEKIYDSIRSSHPSREYPCIFDLTAELPSTSDIQSSFILLQQLCVYDPLKDWNASDSKWFSQLESSHWMEMMSKCLNMAQKVSEVLSSRRLSVIIKEYSSTDLSPLIGSLVQIMLNEESRTIAGFQGVVKREWVAMGHKFGSRLQSRSFNLGNETCPVFLLFLDCTYQLTNLKPSSFEFNSNYLVHLWHSVCEGLYRDLLFDSPKDLFYTTMKVQIDFSNGMNLMRKNQLDRTVGARLSDKKPLDSGIMGTLMRKSHLDFSTLKKHMSSLSNLSQSQSMFSPNCSHFSYDSYSLKQNRSQLSKFSTLSINSKSSNIPSPNLRKSQLQLPSMSTCDSDWSDFLSDLPTLKKSSLSQQKLASSQILDQSDISYEDPWTDLIGEISRAESSSLWDWSFIYDSSQIQLFKSFEYMRKQTNAEAGNYQTHHCNNISNGSSLHSDQDATLTRSSSKQKNFQKSALIIKGQKIYNYLSFARDSSAALPEFSKVNFSVSCLLFWSSCHLRFHPSSACLSCPHDSIGSTAKITYSNEFDDDYLAYNQILCEIQKLEKCLQYKL